MISKNNVLVINHSFDLQELYYYVDESYPLANRAVNFIIKL
jgi:hypothetical protein